MKTPSAILQYATYPLLISGAFILFQLGGVFDLPLVLKTYIPPTLVALLIIFFEMRYPYRREWLPAREDIKNDLIFMVVVQITLPLFLSFLLGLALIAMIPDNFKILADFWPQSWPVWAQTILMLLISDFLRYWLHRLCHETPRLWRLHAVHHSPEKLYWLNVGRFHPVEKSMQFLLDTLPFVLAGVSPEILALYYIFYASHGFFQHSNANIKLGVLNFFFSGPELHRWHHSVHINESNANYANNFIIWDMLFNTRFFPSNREVEKLGLINPEYPKDFMTQLSAPFQRSDLTKPPHNKP